MFFSPFRTVVTQYKFSTWWLFEGPSHPPIPAGGSDEASVTSLSAIGALEEGGGLSSGRRGLASFLLLLVRHLLLLAWHLLLVASCYY